MNQRVSERFEPTIHDDYTPSLKESTHSKKNGKVSKSRASSQKINISTILESSPKPQTSLPIRKEVALKPLMDKIPESLFQEESSLHPQQHTKIPENIQQAIDELASEEASFILGEKSDVFDVMYEKDQEAAKMKYDGFTGSMKYYAIKGGQKALDWMSNILRSAFVQAALGYFGVVTDTAMQGTTTAETFIKYKHHKAQTTQSRFETEQILKNSQLSSKELGNIKEKRLEKIIEKKELESLLHLNNEDLANKNWTYEGLVDHLTSLKDEDISQTERRLLRGFINGLGLQPTEENEDNPPTISFSDLQNQYANHTIGLSFMARKALIEQNRLKNESEKKIFQWERTSSGLEFSISISAAITWFTLNILTVVGVGVSSSAMPALSGAVLGVGCALSLIGLGVLAYRSPHQALEVVKLTYIRKSFNWMKNFTLKNVLGYNKVAVKESKKKIEELKKELNNFKSTNPYYSEPHELTAIETSSGKTLYLNNKDKKNYLAIEKKIRKEKSNLENIEKKVKDISASAAYYNDKITKAKIKDHQRSHRLYEKLNGNNEYIEKFMDEVAFIAAQDISRETDDRLAKDVSNLLVRQYGVAISQKKDQALSPQEIHESIYKGLEYFMGADTDRLNKINMRLRYAKKSTHRMLIHKTLFNEKTNIEAKNVFAKYGLRLPKLKEETPKKTREYTENLRKYISNHLPKDQAMVLYGQLWNLLRPFDVAEQEETNAL